MVQFDFDRVVTNGRETYVINDELQADQPEYYTTLSNANSGSYRLADREEIDKWNKEVLEPNHLHYSNYKHKIINWKEFNLKFENI